MSATEQDDKDFISLFTADDQEVDSMHRKRLIPSLKYTI